MQTYIHTIIRHYNVLLSACILRIAQYLCFIGSFAFSCLDKKANNVVYQNCQTVSLHTLKGIATFKIMPTKCFKSRDHTCNIHSQRDEASAVRGLLLPVTFLIQLVLLHLALVGTIILLMGPLYSQIKASLGGSGEMKPPLQSSDLLVPWVTQQACVIKLHQGAADRRTVSGVQPSNFVEKRWTGCT